MVTIIRDGLHLSYGYFQTLNNYSFFEIQRGYDIGGQKITEDDIKQYRVLRMGNGITTFKTEEDLKVFLSKVGSYKIYSADLVHCKFYLDRDTLLELSAG